MDLSNNPFSSLPVKKIGRPKEKEKKLSPEEAFQEAKKAIENDPEMRLKMHWDAETAKDIRITNARGTKKLAPILKKMKQREEEKRHMIPKYCGTYGTRGGHIYAFEFEDGRDIHFPPGATLLTRGSRYKDEEDDWGYFICSIKDILIFEDY